MCYSNRLVQVSDESVSTEQVVINGEAELDNMVRREIGAIGAITLGVMVLYAG